jgi:ribulose-phosphate 3-epimerase
MVEILPAILEDSFAGVQEKLKRLEGVSTKAQLDIADGVFVPNKTWNNPEDLDALETSITFDLHLMADRPELWIEKWNFEQIFRYTFHIEATHDVLRTIKIIKDTGKEVGIALNPETDTAEVHDMLDSIDLVLVMAVNPGAQGREFDAKAVDRVHALRGQNSTIAIGVDGHVDAMTAPLLVRAGATMLASGSYIFGQKDIKQAIESLQK